MYKSFYNLSRNPFVINSDSSFLWLGEKHKEALAVLRYGILDNKGFLLLTGEAGTGKTTLINTMTQSFGADVEWAVVNDPTLERIDFYNTIARGFGIEKQFSSKVQFLIQFSHFLHKADDENKKVVLIIDDCHLLSQEMLEELRLLSNIEKADSKLINIFFVGQSEFKNILVQPENRAVRQRLTLKSELATLNVNETEAYVRHRLRVAGTEEIIFNAKAIQMINKYSQGVIKRIDVLCYHLLVAGAAKGAKTIEPKDVATCVQQLNLPSHPTEKDFENIGNVVLDQGNKTESIAAAPGNGQSTVTGFADELGGRRNRGWLKYGFAAALVILIAGTYFWLPSDKIQELPQQKVVENSEIKESNGAMSELPPVSSSPAVAVLEENKKEIDKEKAAELKNAILEKAYNETADVEKIPTDSVVQKEVEKSEEEGSSKALETQGSVVDATTVAQSGDDVQGIEKKETVEGGVATQPDKKKVLVSGSGNVNEVVTVTPETKEAVKEPSVAPTLVPLEPKIVRLPLLPSSLKLTRTGVKRLESFVDKLKVYPRATILIKGFVSSKSNSPENIKLSEDRAESVRAMLLSKGVDPEQIEVVGMGNKEPLATNSTREGRTKNRRVEIIVINDGT